MDNRNETGILDRNLALEVVRVTEAAALSASKWMGRGDEKAADQAAVDSMRVALNGMDIESFKLLPADASNESRKPSPSVSS